MNRFIQTTLIVFFLATTAFSQERDSVVNGRDIDSTQGDSVLASGDTILVSRDSMAVFQDYDSLYRNLEPEIWAARKLEADSLRGDSLSEPILSADSLAISEDPEIKSASRAIMNALVLPGLGQVYNGKYWKVPIVWGAMGVAGYAIAYNTKEYKGASNDYAQNPDDINQRYLEFWRRNMELSYIAMIAIYALQVLDAYVDALLYSWDVNDNLSMGISPSLQPLLAPSSLTGQAISLTCSFNIRGR